MENNQTILSIIIPVYNVEKYLGQCLESLDRQDLSNVEIILVNDGSTDNSGSICDDYAKTHDNVTVISQPNGGLSAARNTGIAHACGDYLLFLDSDDWLNDDAACNLKTLLEKDSTADIIFGEPICYDDVTGEISEIGIESNMYKKYKSPSKLFYHLLKNKNFWFAAWMCIVKRSFIVDNGLLFQPGIYHEDELWVPQIMVKAKKLELVDFKFYCYRENRKGSIVNNSNIKKEFDKLIIIDKLCDGLNSVDSRYEKKLIQERVAALIWGLIRKYNSFSRDEKSQDLLNGIQDRLKFMKWGKYTLAYWYVKIFRKEFCAR